MQKNFRILRNNKEMGPYTLQELLSCSLKPKDLVWVDGQSAGWRYPSEIDSLKKYVDVNDAPAEPRSPEVYASHPASNIVRPPATPVASSAYSTVNAAPGQEGNEEELTAEKIERKAAEIYQRIQAFTQQTGEEPNQSQTKYARSLDDLKQEYADWLNKKKSKKTILTKKNGYILAASLAGIALVSFVLFSNSSKPQKTAVLPSAPIISNAVYTRAQKTLVPKQQPAPAGESKKTMAAAPVNMPAPNTTPRMINGKELSVDKFIDSVERVLAVTENQGRLLHLATLKGRRNLATKTPEVLAYHEPPKLEIAKPQKNITPLSDLVNMNAKYMYDANQQLFGLEVTIQNKSIQVLKKVAVDVFYYKRGGKLFDKETLYFTDIQPGNSFTLSTPGNRRAASAKFQIGQITSSLN